MKPIIFSTPMVQAILDGRKTQTRRLIKFPKGAYPHWYHGQNEDGTHDFMFGEISNGCCLDWTGTIKPPCKYGDVLFVKETWVSLIGFDYEQAYWYRADAENPTCHYKTQWKSPVTMPRSAARLFLKVTDVRAERVQDISAEDARAEGVGRLFESDIAYDDKFTDIPFNMGEGLAVHQFARLWDSINAKRGYGWDSNPFVWVITFERTTV